MGKKAVRATEYLKHFISQTLSDWQAGSLTPEQANLILWNEVQDVLQNFRRRHFRRVFMIRLGIVIDPDFDTKRQKVFEAIGDNSMEVLTVRASAPPDPTVPDAAAVFNFTSEVVDAFKAAFIANEVKQFADVKLWTFGCQKR